MFGLGWVVAFEFLYFFGFLCVSWKEREISVEGRKESHLKIAAMS